MKMKITLALLGFASLAAHTQTPQLSSSEILQGLDKLGTIGSVLYVAAHPDDENTRLLTYFSKERNLRTGYLSITRGDGGQNLVGKEQGELLGLIRTQELLAARRTDGAEQFFTRANDFGYSKNPEETFRIWNKDSVLADMVWVIRSFRPDIIICRFPTTGEGGHGHHTASAILAEEAFEAAADPKRFSSQLKYLQVWQTKRLFWNTFNFGGNNTTSPGQLKLDAGGFNPLLGKSYGEIAAESRSMHKSQGFGSARARGSNLEYFKQLKGDSARSDLFEGIRLDWLRFAAPNKTTRAGTEKMQQLVDEAVKNFQAQSPEKSIPALVEIYRFLQSLPATDPSLAYWKTQKLKETETLLMNCAGLWLEAAAAEPSGVSGGPLELTVQILSRNEAPVQVKRITWPERQDTATALTLSKNQMSSFKHRSTLPARSAFSNPYWLSETHGNGMFVVRDQQLIGKPENEPAQKIIFHLDIGGLPLSVERGVVHRSVDPVKGEIYRPYEVLPPATVNFSEKAYVFGDASAQKIILTVKSNAANVSGVLQLIAPAGWNLSATEKPFELKAKGEEQRIEVTLTPSGKGSGNGKLRAQLKIGDQLYAHSIRRIEYDHIPQQFTLSPAEAALVSVDLKKSGTNIGYIPGAGDDIPAALKQVGYTVAVLDENLLGSEDLSKYDAIVTGVRAYNTNDWLQPQYDKLMAYVKNGGNLIVQYNTNNRIGPIVAKIAPYPLNITRERVTDEQAEVRFVDAKHAALNTPNKISAADFEGWVQERGIYFASDPEKNFQAVLSMNDPNEKANEGSLLIAKYGKGNFVYTGLAFFRQLPAGVPGAYRLFANLLSLPENAEK